MPRDIKVTDICIFLLILKVFSPAKAIFAGIGVLLLVCIINSFVRPFVILDCSQAAKDVRAGQDALFEVFERIEAFFQRLEIYTTAAFSQEMVDIITKIMVEVLNVLGISTKEIRQGRTSRFLLYNYVAVDRTVLRKISKKTDRTDRYRRCAEETGQADARRGSNGCCASPEGCQYGR